AFYICNGAYFYKDSWFNFDGELLANFPGKFHTKQEVEKMSKSKLNVVNPDDMCDKYGADCFRMYEMFLGPLEQSKPWNTNGITGVFGFLKKFWKLFDLTPNPSPEGEGGTSV